MNPVRTAPRAHDDSARQRLVAIVESSEDAIVSKDLEGVIKSWNGGAEQLFGYHEDEAIGRSVSMLIPEDRQHEESQILERIRCGESVKKKHKIWTLKFQANTIYCAVPCGKAVDDGNLRGAKPAGFLTIHHQHATETVLLHRHWGTYGRPRPLRRIHRPATAGALRPADHRQGLRQPLRGAARPDPQCPDRGADQP